MKKNLIIVNSLTNLLIAKQIRTMYSNERFDIIIPDDRDALVELYRNNRIGTFFDNVLCVNYNGVSGIIKKAIAVINSKQGIRYYIKGGIQKDYTDLFFWNPSEFFYYLYSFLGGSESINLHVYADAFGGYIVDYPDEPLGKAKVRGRTRYHFFKKGVWNLFFKIRHNSLPVKDLPFDYYMFNPGLSYIKRSHDIVEVPWKDNPINLAEINYLYNYDAGFQIENKWIVFTNVPNERRKLIEDKRVFGVVFEELKGEKVSIKPHPRCNFDYADAYDFQKLNNNIPIELFFLNNDTRNYILISDESSAIFLTALVFEKKVTVIWLRSLFDGDKIYNNDIWNHYLKTMSNNGCICYDPKNYEELRDCIKTISRNMNYE